jgi:hypothetical protein
MFGRSFESRLLFSPNSKQSSMHVAHLHRGQNDIIDASKDADNRTATTSMSLLSQGRVPSGLLSVGRGASRRAMASLQDTNVATRSSTAANSVSPSTVEEDAMQCALLQYEIEVPRSQPLSVNLTTYNMLSENSVKFAYRMRVREHTKVIKQEAHIMSFASK